MKSVILLLVLLVIYQAQDDLVTNLTQITGYDKPWYSGYLNISTPHEEMMSHYWFFPSEDKKWDMQTIVWLSGGPGCSSLLGAVQENGPFIFKKNSTEIVLNPNAWNKKANLLYIDMPSRVGYSTGKCRYCLDEDNIAYYTMWAIKRFQQKYGGYHDWIYLAGEGYAGITIPKLANEILRHNNNRYDKIELQGIIVGNGCVHPLECSISTLANPFSFATMAGQGWYTPEILKTWEEKCGSWTEPEPRKLRQKECTKYYADHIREIGKNVNMYNIIGQCYHQQMDGIYGQLDLQMEFKYQYYTKKLNLEEEKLNRRRFLNQTDSRFPSCADGIGPMTFFNDNSVKAALHVDQNIEWKMCDEGTIYFSDKGSYELYPKLMRYGLQIWLYSGDTDAMVPISGTLYWLNKLVQYNELKDRVPWRAWYTEGIQPGNRQNAGQFWKTTRFTFVSHKGCGNRVPYDCPVSAYDMIQAFLYDTILPSY